MDKNFTIAFLYFIYLGIAMVLSPAKKYNMFSQQATIEIAKEEVPVAREETDILHGELLFKF